MDWIYGKTILITGASSGLGRAMTLQLIREHGCMVLGIGQSEEKMKSLIEELSYLRDQFKYWIFDVSQEENWNTFREELTYNNINVDLLINNAGMLLPFEKSVNYTEEQVKRCQEWMEWKRQGFCVRKM